MSQVSEIISRKIIDRGGNKSEMARLLGISSQLLGQYANGRHKPKPDFYVKWKEVFGEDFLNETNVSSGNTTKEGYAQPGTQKVTIDVDILLNIVKDANARILQKEEERRKETEARLLVAEKEKDKLLDLLGISLNKIEKYGASTLAQVEAHIHHEAFREANGDSKVEKRILEEVNKKAGDLRKIIVGAGTLKVGNKKDKAMPDGR